MTHRVLQICPEFPPEHGGIGDFAHRLGEELRVRGIVSIVAARGATDAPGVHALRGGRLEEDLRACLATHEGTPILLHYVGYGFDERACPFWLPRAVSSGRARLVVHFHETWAAGPVWHSTFWNVPLQRWIALRLAAAADAVLCGSARGLGHVRGSCGPSADARILQSPSNVGEPVDVPPVLSRANEAVVFGLPAIRARLFRRHGRRIEGFCRDHGIRLLHDVGPALASPPPPLSGVEVRAPGYLPSARVSELLAGARYLFVDYDPDLLTKSGTVAAGMAHGNAIVNFAASGGRGGEYWQTPEWGGFRGDVETGSLATAARLAYRERSWPRVAEVIAEALSGAPDTRPRRS